MVLTKLTERASSLYINYDIMRVSIFHYSNA